MRLVLVPAIPTVQCSITLALLLCLTFPLNYLASSLSLLPLLTFCIDFNKKREQAQFDKHTQGFRSDLSEQALREIQCEMAKTRQL